VLVRWVAVVIVAILGARDASAEGGQSSSNRAAAPVAFGLAGIHAHLFYEPLGKIDERDLVTDKIGLWNTIIGEGDAEAPSSTTMVTVDVAGPSFPTGTKGTISFVAKSEKRLLRRETVKLEEFFSEGSKLSIPFVVVGTGCGTLKIDVELSMKGSKSRLSKTLEYPCGE